MSATAPPAAPVASDLAERRRALVDRHLETLDQLVGAGMGMVGALAAQVAGTGAQVIEGDVALAYSRFSRAVRMAILLQSHLLAEPAEAAKAGGSDDDDDGEPREVFTSWMESEHEKRQGRRERIEHIVERIARAEGEPEEAVERLAKETYERLERIDVYGDVGQRPVSEVVAEICRDLGLKPDWAVLKSESWARKEVADGEVGWPLKDGPPPPEDWIGPWPPEPRPRLHYDHQFPSRRTRRPWAADPKAWTAEMQARLRPLPLAGEGDP